MKTWHEVRSLPFAVRLLLVNQLGVNTGFYLLVPYLATHLGENPGMSAAVVGVVLGVRNLSRQGLFLIGGSASDRLGARGMIIAGCALRTVGFALFALGDGLAVLLAASVLSGVVDLPSALPLGLGGNHLDGAGVAVTDPVTAGRARTRRSCRCSAGTLPSAGPPCSPGTGPARPRPWPAPARAPGAGARRR
ncbi:MFS family permease [Streptomyces canus]|nr:MFS family permease [Streptomyces canus]